MAKILIEVTDKASKPLKKVEKQSKDTDLSLQKVREEAVKTGKDFAKAAIGVAALGTAMATGVKAAIEADRAMFGLDESTRKYIRSASELYGINETLISQWTRTLTSAGLAGDEIESMMDSAVALGRLYPNEQTEEFVDNLRQFVTTGEDAGFVTDVLESHFKTTKLETIAFTDKMKALKNITNGVNDEFAKTKAGRYDRVMTELANSTTDFGNAVLDLLEGSGALWVFNKALTGLALSANGYAQAFAYAKSVMGVEGADAELDALIQKATDLRKVLGGQDLNEDGVSLGTLTVSAPAGANFDSAITDKMNQINEEALRINEQFWDDYQATTMNATEYQLTKLAEQYEVYDKYVKDKVALEEWFNTEVNRIMSEQVTDYKEFTEGAIDTMANGMSSMFRDWQQGALDFKDSMKRILQEIAAQMFEILVVKQLIGGFSGMMGFAQGGAFVNGVQKFASGGVVTSPTVFPMATGIGLMGEAGAEAIMPLSRTKSGDLGVQATVPVVNVNVENYGNSEVSVTQDGDDINIILSQIASSIQRGTGDVGNAIQSRYGLQKV